MNEVENGLVVGNRIPRDYFIAKGSGQSDIAIHAGSFHLALLDAGISICNIMTYSSILPSIAREVERPKLRHGSVMETIMAVAHATSEQFAVAGIIYGWLYDKQTGRKHGGVVCEHTGEHSVEEIIERLNASLAELYEAEFADRYDLKDTRIITESIRPEKQYGTALVALCFTSYVHPQL